MVSVNSLFLLIILLHCCKEIVEARPESTAQPLVEDIVNGEKEYIKLGPVITIKYGQLRPKILQSRAGRDYNAFLGIPYATPPIRNQRFMEPNPFGNWEGIRTAVEYGPRCIQYDLLQAKVDGEEDCLHLNVFTPQLPTNVTKKLLPVMVFIHQGAFMFGYSKDYEAKYMMDEDMVLVTFNYRLGSFGFLNTVGDSDAKGNMGLKDQVLVLQWIKENIHHFGGEKHQVTIFGESAGGASVHYHLLSEMSKDLFSRGISQSGTALCPWAFTRNPRKHAKRLGTMLNCPTTDMSELFVCLQGKDAKEIAQKHQEFFEWNTDPISPFAPSVEASPEQYGVFLKETPYSLIKRGNLNHAPWMIGLVDNVCLLDAHSILVDKQLVTEINTEWHRIAPLSLMFGETALEVDAVSNQIRAFYFGSKGIGNETAQNLTSLYSDRYFNHCTRIAALLHSRANEANRVFLYYFTYQGKQSHMKFIDVEDKLGVSEGDELQYLFNMGRFDELDKNSEDEKISQNLIRLWFSFAEQGKPANTWNGTEWKHVSTGQVKGDEALMYYQLDKQCKFVDEPFASRMSFWDNLPLNEYEDEMINPYSRNSGMGSSDFEDILGE